MASLSSEFHQHQILELVKVSQERRYPPLIWAMEVGKLLQEAGVGLPSPELGQILVSHLCWNNNHPTLWKFIEQAINCNLVSPLQVLALLTARVIPQRRSQPEAYRLYLELLSQHAFSFASTRAAPCREKILTSIDDSLKLSHTFGVHVLGLGQAVLLFFFCIITCLTDSTLEDWGLQVTPVDKQAGLYRGSEHQDMDLDAKGYSNEIRSEHREQLRRTNALMAMEVVGKLTENRKAMVLLRLARLNMPEKFSGLLQRLQFLEVHKSSSLDTNIASQHLVRLSTNVQRTLVREYHLNKHLAIGMLIDIGSCSFAPCHTFGFGRAACWVPFDIYMENMMDGKQLPATSAIDILTELTKTLQVINHASWQETFQALWIAALRLVQRERDPLEGPVPHLDARLCILLSITPLAIVRLIDEEAETPFLVENGASTKIGSKCGHSTKGTLNASRRQGLVSSLQALGQFSGLLSPPSYVLMAANNAAAKAASFVANFKSGSESYNGTSHNDTSVKAGANMRHLIVEACIARKLIDTSAYFWPGYVGGSVITLPDSTPVQGFPWTAFMDGAQLTVALKNALLVTPAPSLAEIEKLYHIALNGTEEEKSLAAKILCGASLSRGWNIQEHVVQFVVKLLSPPVPPEFSGPGSHLVAYMPMLNAILFGVCSVDTVHILSLFGVIPEVAASLMPLCEIFGSLTPTANQKPSTSDETSVYTAFSCAFLFLLRLWKFYRAPHEHYMLGRGPPVGSELTLEYLLFLRNSCGSSSHNSTNTTDNTYRSSNSLTTSTSASPVYIHSFPKLKAWYHQNQACIVSTLSGLCSGNPVHQVANKILNMIYRKMNKGGSVSATPSTPSSGSFSGSPVNSLEDCYQRPMLPAWEVLEAVPFVLEAILTACTHGRLPSRELTTGLRDLVDFLPASLAVIVSYFSAEITRGIWKHVPMNGTDWPSPAANLLLVECEIKEILTAVGVECPSYYAGGGLPVMLPLPMAALVGLTITFKLEKSLEFIHGVAGPALEHSASGCPWPSVAIIGALWAQKVRRWHDFIIFSCARSSVKQDKEAVSQLLKSCFTSFLGSSLCHPSLTMNGGVNALLGYCIETRATQGRYSSIAPGFFYIKTFQSISDIGFVNKIILRLVIESVQDLALGWAHADSPISAMAQRLKSNQGSLAAAAIRIKEVATLGASLLCISGGIHVVQLLFLETLPTWLLSAREEKVKDKGPMSSTLEGYVLAYLVVLSGAFTWGTGGSVSTSSRRARVFGKHMDFLAEALEGNISLGCDPATWKAYVSCFVGLVVSFLPAWIPDVNQETLMKLATGLRGWHECELALSLLENGGAAAMGFVAEFFM